MVRPQYGQGNFTNENFPGASQTQVVGINNNGDTVGFWVDGKGANDGFYALKGHGLKTADFPTADNAKPMVDQLLAVNDHDVAVGFYTDSKGNNHGFSYDIGARQFRAINVPGDSGVTTAGINNERDVVGFATNGAGATEGYLLRSDHKLYRLNVPGASATMAFGVNDGDEVVGAYTDGTGDNATTHGFIWAPGFGLPEHRRSQRRGRHHAERGQRPRHPRRFLHRLRRKHRRPARQGCQLDRAGHVLERPRAGKHVPRSAGVPATDPPRRRVVSVATWDDVRRLALALPETSERLSRGLMPSGA